ncbi:MAG: TIGR02217 family protein [Brevundimonas sp.]|jgi:uncharacterized protein (TIGR02217 family)|uniref:phage distal tail protein, Rcc01695 family n=1 Tax=Brevundimonas sp. TaxID=1871086 RepID=UPI00391B1E11
MGFHEVRLPARLAFGSSVGVEHRTEVASLASGFERRSSPWSCGRRRYLIGAGLRSLADMGALMAFFEARHGRLYGFRFRDISDEASAPPGQEPMADDQSLGTGNGSQRSFALVKHYGHSLRPITKPVAGSVKVAVAGVETSTFTLDETTGIVTFDVAPASGATVTAGFRFDVPVRFDTDRIDVTLEGFASGRLVAVPLIEVRV